jgi:lysozyme
MAFNLGLGRLRKFRKCLAALEAGDYDEAAAEALNSAWAAQVGARAQRIAAMIREG